MNDTSQNSLNIFQKDSRKRLRESISTLEGELNNESSNKSLKLNTSSLLEQKEEKIKININGNDLAAIDPKQKQLTNFFKKVSIQNRENPINLKEPEK